MVINVFSQSLKKYFQRISEQLELSFQWGFDGLIRRWIDEFGIELVTR
jgi:hypothetical protein